MRPDHSISFLLRLAIVVAIPTMACFAYYTLERLGEEHSGLAVPAVLALPLALIGLAGTVSAVLRGKRTNIRLVAFLLCLIVPLIFLATIWFG